MRGVVIFRKCQPWDKIVKNEKRICNRGSTSLWTVDHLHSLHYHLYVDVLRVSAVKLNPADNENPNALSRNKTRNERGWNVGC